MRGQIQGPGPSSRLAARPGMDCDPGCELVPLTPTCTLAQGSDSFTVAALGFSF